MTVLLESALKVSAVLLVALAAVWLLRWRSAAARHWVLSAAILLAAMMPVLEPLAPSWQMRLDAASGFNAVTRIFASPTAPAVSPTAAFAESTSVAASEIVTMPAAQQAADARGATKPIAMRLANAARAMRATELLGAIWLLGIFISLATLAAGLARLAWLASHARPLRDARWTGAAAAIARDYGIRRRVTLLHSDHPALLVTWGLLRPRIIVPAAALHWTDDRIHIVLSHELAHVRRHDWAMQIAAALVRAVYWFNPLAWIACRRLRQDSEQACDDVVLARGVDAPEYATHLLEFARALTAQRRRDTALPAQAIARASGLERRITAMLDVDVNRRVLSRSARLTVLATLLGLALPIAGFQVFAQNANARLSGTVTDPSGAPVPEASVVIIDQQAGTRRSMTTDHAGRFVFLDVKPATYLLAAEAPAFKPFKENVQLSAGQAAVKDLRLALGTLQETITVGVAREEAKDERLAAPTTDVKAREIKRHPDSVGSVTPPRRIQTATVTYPQALMDAGIGDRVVLDARIGTDGSIVDIKVRSSKNPELAKAAIDAVNQWKYTPTLLHGKPVEVEIVAVIEFNPPQK